LSPALTSEIGFISPDWSVTLSEPAKQFFFFIEEVMLDVAATGVDGNFDGVEVDGYTIVTLVR
jgi:hypothetical protein